MTNFNSLGLKSELISNLEQIGFHNMTPIQEKSLPLILDGKDLIAQAKTGSGKTASFGLGILNKLKIKDFSVQTLVLCPTRELADQVAKEIRRLAQSIHNIKVLTLCGGTPMGPQIGSLAHGAHIIVGTPGRIEAHLRKQTLSLSNIKTLVLDEADRMLDMGFQESIDAIVSETPKERQTLLFSATFPKQINDIAQRVLTSPVRVTVATTHDTTSIDQHYYEVLENEKFNALLALLGAHQPESTLVFCNTKKDTQSIADKLNQIGFEAIALHGDLEQKQREQALVYFANKSVSILVSTDVAARGLDIEALDAVINFEIAKDTEVHVHRIGRTGRAGNKGLACTLFSEREKFKLEKLEAILGHKIEPKTISTQQNNRFYRAPNVTLQIDGGKKQKLRPGDLLGALTADNQIPGTKIGKINIFDHSAFVAIEKSLAQKALAILNEQKIKGRKFRARQLTA